jgi:dolichol-phosphate mannosyltransferase
MKNNSNTFQNTAIFRTKVDISFVIPVFNEEENIPVLFREIQTVADQLDATYEVVFVNDCSTDDSLGTIHSLAVQYPAVRCLSFPMNRGQSAALGAGFRIAAGDIIITMDADLQNDPADIPKLLSHFGDYDMVNGWRRERKDTWSKRISSRIGNFVRNRLTGDTIRDTGCSLKVMRADMLKNIKMYRGLHRFLPILMRLEGARIIEVPVNHRHRRFGVSKYTNLRRGVEGFQDLLAVRWMMKRHVQVDGEIS